MLVVRGISLPVENARMISPDPCAAMLPARPMPSATRFETRPNWWELRGASVASTAMMLPALVSRLGISR